MPSLLARRLAVPAVLMLLVALACHPSGDLLVVRSVDPYVDGGRSYVLTLRRDGSYELRDGEEIVSGEYAKVDKAFGSLASVVGKPDGHYPHPHFGYWEVQLTMDGRAAESKVWQFFATREGPPAVLFSAMQELERDLVYR